MSGRIPDTPDELLKQAESVMTPDHSRFLEFAAAAAQWEIPDDCGGRRFPRTRALLRLFGCDEERSLVWMADHGGCRCDCQVAFNFWRWADDLEPYLRPRAPKGDEGAVA